MSKLNWLKVIGNSGCAFCFTMTSMFTYDYLAQSGLEFGEFLIIAFIASVLQGLTAFFREIKIAAEQHIPLKVDYEMTRKKETNMILFILDKLTLF